MKLGMFTLKSDTVWVPHNRPLFSTAPTVRAPIQDLPTPEPTLAGASKPNRQAFFFDDEATLS